MRGVEGTALLFTISGCSHHKGPDSVSSRKEMEEEGRARVEQRTLRIQCSHLLPLAPQKQRQ